MNHGTEQGRGAAAGAIASATTGVAAAGLTLVSVACCASPVIAPIIVGVLGASGAVWAAGLKPYGAWILAASFVSLLAGFWSVYRPRRDCALTDASGRTRILQRIAKVSVWIGAAFWIGALLTRLILPR